MKSFASPQDVVAHWSRVCEAGVVQLGDLNFSMTWIVRGDGGGRWQITCNESVRFEAQAEGSGVLRTPANGFPREAAEVLRDDDDYTDQPASCILEMNSADFLQLAGGTANPQLMFLDKRLRVAGTLSGVLRTNAALKRLLAASGSK